MLLVLMTARDSGIVVAVLSNIAHVGARPEDRRPVREPTAMRHPLRGQDRANADNEKRRG